MRNRSSLIPPQRGFTYIGLLILILLIAGVSAATLSTGAAMQRREAEEELLFIGEQFQRALKSYAEATPMGQLRYPREISELLRDPRYPSPRRHLRKLFVDPLTGSAQWGTVSAPEGGILGVYSLSTETPIRMMGFPDNLAHLESKTRYSDWVFLGEPPIKVQEKPDL